MRLWGRPTSINVQKVLWTLAECGLEAERIDAGGEFGGVDSPAYLALNPNGSVPTLEDEGAVIWESHAIVRYLAARYAPAALWDEDPARRAAADKWMDWVLSTAHADLTAAFWHTVRLAPDRRDPRVAAAAAAGLGPKFAIVAAQLSRTQWLAADRLTTADIAVGSCLHRYYRIPIERDELPALRAYYDRLADRPAYRDTIMTPYDPV